MSTRCGNSNCGPRNWGWYRALVSRQVQGSLTFGNPVFFLPNTGCSNCYPPSAVQRCTVSDGGRCVGRPDGYQCDVCEINVRGGGGALVSTVFELRVDTWDHLQLPGSVNYYAGHNSPEGVILLSSDLNTGNYEMEFGSLATGRECQPPNVCARWQLCLPR